MTEFFKKHWKWILLAAVVLVAILLYLRRRKKEESGFNLNETGQEVPGACVDCGEGGMFGPGWTMEKFQGRVDELRKRAGELSNGLKGEELNRAVQRAGGLVSYIQGRETAIKRIEEATNNLKGVMNIPGVHGIGTIMGDHIEIMVIDNTAKQKVIMFIEQKKKEKAMIPSHGKGYMGYPVKIVIQPMMKAQ